MTRVNVSAVMLALAGMVGCSSGSSGTTGTVAGTGGTPGTNGASGTSGTSGSGSTGTTGTNGTGGTNGSSVGTGAACSVEDGIAMCATADNGCVGGYCCPDAQLCGGGNIFGDGNVCCDTGYECLQTGTSCCATAQVCNGGNTCCGASQSCVGGECCATADVCGTQCCTSGEVCVTDGQANKFCTIPCHSSGDCNDAGAFGSCCAPLSGTIDAGTPTTGAYCLCGPGDFCPFTDAQQCLCQAGPECGSGCCAPVSNGAGNPIGPYVCNGSDTACCNPPDFSTTCQTTGTTCVTDTHGNQLCEPTCTSSADCGAASCLTYASGGKACGP